MTASKQDQLKAVTDEYELAILAADTKFVLARAAAYDEYLLAHNAADTKWMIACDAANEEHSRDFAAADNAHARALTYAAFS